MTTITTPSRNIVISIPVEFDIPNIDGFSVEENYWMLKIGSDAIHTGKRGVTDSLVVENIREEMAKKYEKELEIVHEKWREAENQVLIAKKCGEKMVLQKEEEMETEIHKRVKYQIDKYAYVESYNREEIQRLRELIMSQEKELVVVNTHIEKEIALKMQDQMDKWKDVLQWNKDMVEKSRTDMETFKDKLTETEKELIKWKEQYNQVLHESNYKIEKEVNAKLKIEYDKLKDTIDAVNKKQTSNVHIGDKGENIFEEIAAKTFRDFEGFELKNVSSQMYSGDFHLLFKKFNVLVDTKYYSNEIDKKQRDKIKHDMVRNSHISFGWIISLDSSINRFNKAPFQFEWTIENRCICYINNFLKYDDPSEILRAVWFSCSLIYDIAMNRDTETVELEKWKKKEAKIKELAEKIMKNSKERDLTMNQLKENFETNDKMVREIMNMEINNIFQEHYDMVYTWWHTNLEYCQGGKLTANKIYKEFKKLEENMEEKISEDYFKTILYSFLDEKSISRPKTKNGKVDIQNIGWKALVVL
jgi:hypothetical protein